MILHLFNSSSVSGPERLVLPALAPYEKNVMIVNLREERLEHLRTADPLEAYAQSFHLRYRVVKVRRRWDLTAMEELRQLLIELHPDLVHVHSVKGSIYLGQARPKAQRFRMVTTHHGVHGLPDWKSRLYERFYRAYSFKVFDRILCVSHADYGFLGGARNDHQKLRLHLNGINGRFVAEHERSEESRRVRALWMPEEMERERFFLFGVVGRLSAEKDHARLLHILSILHRLPSERPWRCLVFGTGALEEKLKKQARSLGLDDRVLWMGHRKTVGEELAGLDLLLSFSKAEGMPINLMEAGWAGTAVMSTKVGGVLDLIPDESYGQWVLPEEWATTSAERMHELLSMSGQRQLHLQGRRFQKRVTSEFTQEKWTQRLTELYSEMNVRLASPTPTLAPDYV